MEVCICFSLEKMTKANMKIGIGPKVTQSVITAAFLFAFKDALYAYTIQARKKLALRKA